MTVSSGVSQLIIFTRQVKGLEVTQATSWENRWILFLILMMETERSSRWISDLEFILLHPEWNCHQILFPLINISVAMKSNYDSWITYHSFRQQNWQSITVYFVFLVREVVLLVTAPNPPLYYHQSWLLIDLSPSCEASIGSFHVNYGWIGQCLTFSLFSCFISPVSDTLPWSRSLFSVMSLCETRNRTTSLFSFFMGTMSSRHQNLEPVERIEI